VPTYQYACTECGNAFETVQSFTDDALTVCDTCGGRLRKVFGSVGIVFKGSGFYRTDSREAAKSATTAKDKSATSVKDKGSESKGSESKGSEKKKADSPAATSGTSSDSSGSKTPAPSGSSTKGSAA
jgi:putative FmdB family regulatory protein